MTRTLDARRNLILALALGALVCKAAASALGVGLMVTVTGVPMAVANLLLAATWSWWHLAVVVVAQTGLLFIHAFSSLSFPWFVLLLSCCVALVMSHVSEPPQ